MRGYHQKANDDVVVIVLHGIGGNKLGNKYIFKDFSDFLSGKALSSLRLDFIGSGESDGEFKNTSHIDQIEQLNKIVEYAKKELNYKEIILCSTTIGSYIIWNYVNIYSPDSNLMINWNPITDFDKYKKDNLSNVNSDNIIDLNGLTLGENYVSSLKELNPQIPGLKNVHCIQGNLDHEYKTNDCKTKCIENDWSYFEIDGANHLWEGTLVRQNLFAKTYQIIKEHLNL